MSFEPVGSGWTQMAEGFDSPGIQYRKLVNGVWKTMPEGTDGPNGTALLERAAETLDTQDLTQALSQVEDKVHIREALKKYGEAIDKELSLEMVPDRSWIQIHIVYKGKSVCFERCPWDSPLSRFKVIVECVIVRRKIIKERLAVMMTLLDEDKE